MKSARPYESNSSVAVLEQDEVTDLQNATQIDEDRNAEETFDIHDLLLDEMD